MVLFLKINALIHAAPGLVIVGDCPHSQGALPLVGETEMSRVNLYRVLRRIFLFRRTLRFRRLRAGPLPTIKPLISYVAERRHYYLLFLSIVNEVLKAYLLLRIWISIILCLLLSFS
jgi:hypothetical protein